MDAIVVKDLSFTYPDGTVALDTVSFRVNNRESVGIVGANGAGKSTLVHHLNGYLLPQNGVITVMGTEVVRKTQEKIRRVVGIVFQNPDDQLFMPRLYDDIAFGPRNMGITGEELCATVESGLRQFDLWDLREKPPSHMSQGQKRFSAFAAVLVMKPSVLVMDEPTSDVDPRNRRKLIQFINAMDMARITVSHDLDFILDTCTRVVLMASGKIVAEGRAEELLSSRDLLEAHGLELPLRHQK